jgi:hypothetical protein
MEGGREMRLKRHAGRPGNHAEAPASQPRSLLPGEVDATQADVARYILAALDDKAPECPRPLAAALALATWSLMLALSAEQGMSAQEAADRSRLYLAEVAEGAIFHG